MNQMSTYVPYFLLYVTHVLPSSQMCLHIACNYIHGHYTYCYYIITMIIIIIPKNLGSYYDLCVCSLEPQIKQSTNELGQLLSKVKGAGQVSLSQPSQRNIIQDESDKILRPLMDFLDNQLTVFAQMCEKTVLKRLLKELWKIVMHTLEKMVVLPPLTDPRQVCCGDKLLL